MASNKSITQTNDTMQVKILLKGGFDKGEGLQKYNSESNLVSNEELKRNALSDAKKKELLQVAVSAFMNNSKHNIDGSKKNKWLLWKHKDQILNDEKRRNKWLEEAESDTRGYAVGRRNYEKAEILVRNISS